MVRIAGVDVPDRKRAHVALRSIYGIGPTIVEEILTKADLDTVMPPRMNELSEGQVDRLREIIDREYMTEGDLRRDVNQNIRRLIDFCIDGVKQRCLSSGTTTRFEVPLRTPLEQVVENVESHSHKAA